LAHDAEDKPFERGMQRGISTPEPTRYNDDFPSISPSQKRQKAKLTGVLAAFVD
jgi:hypothetical protein